MSRHYELTEPAPRVHRIDSMLGGRLLSLYLVRGDREALLFDTGVRGTITDSLLPALAEVGVEPAAVRTVLVSHCDVDHFGGIEDVRAHLPSARLLAHERDRPIVEDIESFLASRGRGFAKEYGLDESAETIAWMREVGGAGRLDGVVEDGDALDLGGVTVRVHHVPGHTEGHIAVGVHDGSVLIVGDAVLGESVDLADGTPAFPPTYRYVDDYRRTIAQLATMEPALLLTAHYPTMGSRQASLFLDRSRSYTTELEQIVVDELGRREGASLDDLLEAVNPLAGSWPQEGTEGALAYPVIGHLEDLESRGIVRRSGVPGDYRWALA
ncbi:glyoxylase-like metal-dependent hydrolase (beta-lactamase superfamily II) [Microbacterium sp. SLBN-154]|uniref:MBL fold metallo-hydrolase n=1 Tax=Microbacterium sp. SLBN-154 TaxID=2768458 RepID=UPI0011695066|nr:MBL fold metallo-hydrolase [Microbacterium sp. SLBN-154]TQK17672.1 glyoxylase-like metal-dependent hydrolase (beta-lactamase superfamily II) [Microbacterium sp. SLBN-154]